MVLKKLFGKREAESAKTPANTAAASTAQSAVPAQNSDVGASTAQESGQESGEPKAAEYLELAMVENARNDTPDSRRKVYQELLFSELLLALAEPDPNAAPAAGEDGQNMTVAILQNSAGTPFAAAFTSGAAARRWRPDGGQYVSVKGQDIFKLLEPSPAEVIVVNPGSAPFIILNKVEYRQLAMGIVPQTANSPVQIAAGNPEQGADAGGGDGQMQVAFPPDVFTAEQRAHAADALAANSSIEAAVLGAILPPNAGQDGWIRTIFLRVSGLTESPEDMQAFSLNIRNGIVDGQQALFENSPFEVGVMPDPNFWQAMHQHEAINKNGNILFDKNPPPMSQPEAKDGVVDAHLEA